MHIPIDTIMLCDHSYQIKRALIEKLPKPEDMTEVSCYVFCHLIHMIETGFELRRIVKIVDVTTPYSNTHIEGYSSNDIPKKKNYNGCSA